MEPVQNTLLKTLPENAIQYLLYTVGIKRYQEKNNINNATESLNLKEELEKYITDQDVIDYQKSNVDKKNNTYNPYIEFLMSIHKQNNVKYIVNLLIPTENEMNDMKQKYMEENDKLRQQQENNKKNSYRNKLLKLNNNKEMQRERLREKLNQKLNQQSNQQSSLVTKSIQTSN
jgi:hypothetical protein